MKRIASWFIIFTVAFATFFGGMISPARADVNKPIVTVSFSGYNAAIGDIKAVGQLADNPSLASMVELVVQMMPADILRALDKNSPMGLLVLEEEGEYGFLAFLPFGKKEAIINFLVTAGGNIDIENRDDGITVLNAGGPDLYLKTVGKFTYLASSEAFMADLPEDPASLLGGMDEKYALGVKVFLSNLSEESKDWFFNAIEEGMDIAAQVQGGSAFEAMAAQNKKNMELMKAQLGDLKSMELGYTMDREAGQLKMILAIEVMEGSEPAKIMAKQKEMRSKFAGFGELDVIAYLYGIELQSQDEELRKIGLETIDTVFDLYENMLLQGMPNDDEKAEKYVKMVMSSLSDVLKGCVGQDVAESGMIVDLEPGNITGVLVLTTKNPEAIVTAFKDLTDALTADDLIEKKFVKMNAAKWEGMTFHTLAIPLDAIEEKSESKNPEGLEEAKKVFGEAFVFTVGAGDGMMFIGYGGDAVAMLKKGMAAKAENSINTKAAFSGLRTLKYTKQMMDMFAPKDDPETAQVMYVLKLIHEILASEAGQDHLAAEARILNDTTMELSYVAEKGVVKLLGSIPNIYIMLQMADDEDLEAAMGDWE